MTKNLDKAIWVFDTARDYMARAGLQSEIQWQRQASLHATTEQQFLMEAAWVVMCSGFREATVRKHFDYVSLCFCDWISAEEIVRHKDICVSTAQSAFGHRGKLSAIVEIAAKVNRCGFASFWSDVLRDPFRELRQLPYIGDVTSRHLYKNLGGDVEKPDRHLIGIARSCGYSDPGEFCRAIAKETRETLKVIDLVIWRYLADNPTSRSQLLAS